MAQQKGSFEKLVEKTNLFDNKAVFAAAHSATRRMLKALGGSYSATFSFVLKALYTEKRLQTLKAAAKNTFRRSDDEICTDVICFLNANNNENPNEYSRWERDFIADMNTISVPRWSCRQREILLAIFGGYSYAKAA